MGMEWNGMVYFEDLGGMIDVGGHLAVGCDVDGGGGGVGH
jgi:hypothetical protein